jgi:dsRNA-specific ribonuclease
MRQLDFETEEIIHNRQKLFNIKVFVDKKNIGESENLSKKKAEQMAAQKALETLQAIIV